MRRGALMLDTRSHEQRVEHGVVPGALRMHRNVLEWRVAPSSEYRDPRVARCGAEIIVMCHEGYSSSLAAASLQSLGVARATDLAGGFLAWRDAGLPVQPFR